MKQRDAIAKQIGGTDWINYITKVLALIGLWQVISNSTALLIQWF